MYLNNAATSYPKPKTVTAAVLECLSHPPASSGRGTGGCDGIERCRQRLAPLLGLDNHQHLCFAASGTDALNTAILGTVEPGSEVVTTDFDHNSVSRPLSYLARAHGVRVRRVGLDTDASIALGQLRDAVTDLTRTVTLTHVSNVTGAILPLEEFVEHLAERRVTVIVDASQSLGLLPIALSALPGRVILAAAAHKGLYAPSGLGLLCVPDDGVAQRVHGGTGVRSNEEEHPKELPLRHEGGTPNDIGIAGLEAGVAYLLEHGIHEGTERRAKLVTAARNGLARLPTVELAPLPNADGRAGIVAFRVRDRSPDEVGHLLDTAFGIQVRSGLHCAPLIHRALGTAQTGLIRASFGAFNSEDDALALVDAIRRITLS